MPAPAVPAPVQQPLRPPIRVLRIEGGPTFYERRVLDHLRSAEDAFTTLNDITAEEAEDFRRFVRVLERQVMSRLAARALAEIEAA